MKKVYKMIGDIMNTLAVVAMILTFAVVFFNVILRYIFRTGIVFTEELAQYLFVGVCLLGIVPATRDRSHFAVTMLVDAMPKIVNKIFKLISNIIILVVTTWMLFGGLQMANVLKGTISPAMHIPASVLYWLLVASAAVMMLYSIVNTWVDLFGDKTKPEEDSPEVEGSEEA